jgi:hypothetical protein
VAAGQVRAEAVDLSNGSRFISLLALAAVATAGCGSAPVRTAQPVAEASAVRLALVTPDGGTVTSSGHITVRGTVSPADAIVVIQGRPASVRDGVFTGQARLHRGRTTIDVIASAGEAVPGAASVTVTRRSPSKPAPRKVVVRTVLAPAPAPAVAPGSCAAGVSVGPNTSCPFALNVRDAYDSHGPGTVIAYSPVTRRTYAMFCSRTAPVVCTGGENASVYLS